MGLPFATTMRALVLNPLEVRKRSDFVMLAANPLENAYHLAKQRHVVKNSFVYDSASMAQLWPSYRPLPKFFWSPRGVKQVQSLATEADRSAGALQGIEAPTGRQSRLPS
jgi:hypothetical protein